MSINIYANFDTYTGNTKHKMHYASMMQSTAILLVYTK